MALHPAMLTQGFTMPACEKHFHDYDEAWLILAGSGSAYLIDREGARQDVELSAGDVLMIPAGFEHGSDGPNTFAMNALLGTLGDGSHVPGHYYVEDEGYVPSLQVVRTPSDRYSAGTRFPKDPKAAGGQLGELPVLVLGPPGPAMDALAEALTAAGAQLQTEPGSDAGAYAALALLPGAEPAGALIGSFFAAAKPVAALGEGVGPVLAAGVLQARTVAAPAALQADLAAAGAVTGDLSVCTDTGLVTGASEDDVTGWANKVADVVAEGPHPLQRRSAPLAG